MGNSPPKNKFQITLETQGVMGFCEEILDSIKSAEDIEKLKGIDFDYECLVFEGGGVKGCAYGGALVLLSELGILKKIKRLAGASAGAYMALQVALGVPLDELIVENVIPSMKQFYDSDYWRVLYNVMMKFGWHTGNNLTTILENLLKKYVGKKDITFREFYGATGKELCVVITNLNMRCVKYCHPKTTPDMSVAYAVRTSMSIPMVYQPITERKKDIMMYYIDGGLLDNYPLHCFDGWYLSMKPDDRFCERLTSDARHKFDGVNKKSIGLVVFSHEESQASREVYLKRLGMNILKGRPSSPLAKARVYTENVALEELIGREKMTNAATEIMKFIIDEMKTRQCGDEMSLDQFHSVMAKAKADAVCSPHMTTIFGEHAMTDLEEAFNAADKSNNSKLSLVELLDFLQQRGIYLQYGSVYHYPTKIGDLTAFLLSIIEVMLNYIKDIKIKPEDHERTIGIYTDYVTTTDFDMDYEDKVYIMQQGYRATAAFLKEKVEMKD